MDDILDTWMYTIYVIRCGIHEGEYRHGFLFLAIKSYAKGTGRPGVIRCHGSEEVER